MPAGDHPGDVVVGVPGEADRGDVWGAVRVPRAEGREVPFVKELQPFAGQLRKRRWHVLTVRSRLRAGMSGAPDQLL